MQKKVARGVPDQWVRKFLEGELPDRQFRVHNVLNYIRDRGGPAIGETSIRSNLMVLCEYLGKGLFRKNVPGGQISAGSEKVV